MVVYINTSLSYDWFTDWTCYRCFAAATLEISQPDNEERKEKALAAATNELERIFNKTDFGRMKVVTWIYSVYHCSQTSTPIYAYNFAWTLLNWWWACFDFPSLIKWNCHVILLSSETLYEPWCHIECWWWREPYA